MNYKISWRKNPISEQQIRPVEMMAKDDSDSRTSLLAQLRFSIVAGLLASPPTRGELGQEIARLANKLWKHPIEDDWIKYGSSTIERWYYQVRDEPNPLEVLRHKVRSDRGQTRAMSAEQLCALQQQYLDHRGWSCKLHSDNLKVLCQSDPQCYGPAPSYSTVLRRMEARGWDKRKSRRNPTDGQIRAEKRLETYEVRSYEVSHVNALWHYDFHEAKKMQIADIQGEWHKPQCFGIMDDCSRLCCHAQWYLAENAENLCHGKSQAYQKRDLPREEMHDNGAAMRAEETQNAFEALSIQCSPTLAYSPYQNGKQEKFWDTLEGRLMAMIEKVDPLTLDFLNLATQAWVEQEYNRTIHEELGCSPLDRFLQGPDVSRPAPSSEKLRIAFCAKHKRTQRKSDGTVSINTVRFELPSHLRTLRRPMLRYQKWDLSVAYVVDERDDTILARIRPQDKTKNADGRRRTVAPLAQITETDESAKTDSKKRDTDPVLSVSDPIPPLMRKYLADYAATGLPPAYLPKDEAVLRGHNTQSNKKKETDDD